MLLPPPSHSSPVATPAASHDYVALRAACELVFRNRNTHAWPPDLWTVPVNWEQPFARLAEKFELVETDLEAPVLRVRNFVARILSPTS
jgi:hypothetical protein